ncbi:hypothetical protein ScPMuIL_010560 [Solemya velum]
MSHEPYKTYIFRSVTSIGYQTENTMVDRVAKRMILLTAVILFICARKAYSVSPNAGTVTDDFSGHPCDRECVQGESYVCIYDFYIHNYHTFTADCGDCPFTQSDCFNPACVSANGHRKGIVTVNKMIPGPPIHACKMDTLVINVHNHMIGTEGVAIHWHGIHQRDYPHMDGVGMLTQCPIPSGASFQYRFPAVQSGTHFYHSHAGINRADGMYGAMVIREANDIHENKYDFDLPEHSIVVNDWLKELAVERFFCHILGTGCSDIPLAILVQGHGKGDPHTLNGVDYYTPYSEFHVEQGKKYRFRIIGNGILHCPFKISVDDHVIEVIATDGSPVKGVVVDSVVVQTGERYDFVLHANQPIDNYWFRVLGIGDCKYGPTHQEAILRYTGSGTGYPSGGTEWIDGDRAGSQVNPLNRNYSPGVDIPVTHLESLLPNDHWLSLPPDVYMAWDVHFTATVNPHTHDEHTPQINHITNRIPPMPLLGAQSEHQLIDESFFCNSSTISEDCETTMCACIHRPYADLCQIVEVILIDEGKFFNDSNHPMHLHGYEFRVIGMEKLGEFTTKEHVLDLDGPNHDGLPRNLNYPVGKDTVTIPNGGYTILRFYADNPGFWFFHCHIEFHVDVGMGAFFQVGGYDQIPRVPADFPTCGSYLYSAVSNTNHRLGCLRRGSSQNMVHDVSLYGWN